MAFTSVPCEQHVQQLLGTHDFGEVNYLRMFFQVKFFPLAAIQTVKCRMRLLILFDLPARSDNITLNIEDKDFHVSHDHILKVE